MTLAVAGALIATACAADGGGTPDPERPTVVVSHAVLGSVVQEIIGDRATVEVLIGDGVDPHDFSPSARDIELVNRADLVVVNGLGLEEGLEQTIDQAEADGARVFRAADHITIREVQDDHGDDHGDDSAEEDDDHGHEAGDPHFWVDPVAMRDVVVALAPALESAGIDVADRATDMAARLLELDAEVRRTLDAIPAADRKLVTGHDSMGYFADRYDLEVIGAVIPGLTTQGEVSAGELAALKEEIEHEGVTTIFAEVGTPSAVVESIERETGVRVVELLTVSLPDDRSYATYIRTIADAIAGALG